MAATTSSGKNSAPDVAEHYSHERFMCAALEEARLALEAGDIPVGAVVVHDGEIVSTGRNAVESERNDLLHAEHTAVARIPQFLWRRRRECTVYTTMEPCAMCLGAIVYSAIDRIVWGASDPLAATHAAVEATPYYGRRTLVLLGGVLEAECQALLNEYVRRNARRGYLFKAV
ncbi:MAG TPA: nucleoside deaminase [Casimicrobiaceae bacterium]|nr:nucleoside deaminase [Casimicrobiaceae bacterium]